MSSAPLPREDGEAAASLLSILNANKRADLGGLHSYIRDCQPHLIFLQEVFSIPFLTTLASSYNYQCFTSTLVQPQRPRICAVLSRLPNTTVVELSPGYAQLASVGALSFINIHAPTDDFQHRDLLFASFHPHLALPIPPLLVGDFNCVLHPIDRSSNAPVPRYATSDTLPTLLSAASYSDSFRVLHPTTRVFSMHMRGLRPRGWTGFTSLHYWSPGLELHVTFLALQITTPTFFVWRLPASRSSLPWPPRGQLASTGS